MAFVRNGQKSRFRERKWHFERIEGVKKLFLFRTLARHSGVHAGQPIVRTGKQMVAKGKGNYSASNGSYRWQNRGFANSMNMTDQRIKFL